MRGWRTARLTGAAINPRGRVGLAKADVQRPAELMAWSVHGVTVHSGEHGRHAAITAGRRPRS